MTARTENTSDDNRPITKGMIVLFCTVAGFMLGGVYRVEGIRSDVNVLTKDVQNHAVRIAEVDKQSDERHHRQQDEINALKVKTDSTDKTVNELNTKLSEAVIILKRIDAKTGNP